MGLGRDLDCYGETFHAGQIANLQKVRRGFEQKVAEKTKRWGYRVWTLRAQAVVYRTTIPKNPIPFPLVIFATFCSKPF
jgi:hypothetical protein